MTQVFAKQPAARIHSAQQALQVAEELAERFRSGAAQRDRQRELPHAELQHYFQSGLGAITVPRAWGGIEISSAELAQIFVMLSAADASIGQVPQNHFYALEVLRVNGSAAQQQRLYNEVLAGVHYGNALAEFGSAAAHQRTTAFSQTASGLRLNGDKFYCTGALFADRIPTLAIAADGNEQLVFVPLH